MRSPRTVEPLFDEIIEIEGPPAPRIMRDQPLIFVVGPSVTMPLPILLSTYINTQMNSTSRSYLGIIASVGMSAVIGAGWAIAHYIYNKKVAKKDEKFRVESYSEYISSNEQLIKEKQNYNNSVLATQFLSSADIIEKVSRSDSFLWNRNINHKDFLTVRLGRGNVDFSSSISVPKQRFSLYKDKMTELPHNLLEQFRYIHDSVSTIDLYRNNIIGMIGEDRLVDQTVINIALQIAALHCYTDVKIAAFFNLGEYEKYGWFRWLPHVYSEDMKLRMIADDIVSYQNVLYHIDEVLRLRAERLREENREDTVFYPHYVVICTDSKIFAEDGIEKYISCAEKLGFTFILAYNYIDQLPNDCRMIIQCDKDFSGMYSLENKRGEIDRIHMDIVDPSEAECFARRISGFRVREFATGEIPNSIEYFDMMGIGRIEDWQLIKKYKENRVYEGIKAFVGIGSGGKPVYIDIHEKKYGPHGLVAGTTGSGKSETLQTFIISLALNYHPDEVSFILIDYKGGGMAYAFNGMPHVAGMITNLGEDGEDGEIDENLTRRALVSIRSEIKYRQSVFNRYKVNHIDTYIKLFRSGKAAEPLPHLIIISDEFAELKKEQPEFIKELVSTARVGRSLGIHLILATQKPGGVVDDEIWSNARFRLCLRVQDKQDSMGMLKRPEAAYLTQTGRAYLQIGNDEIFEQFQTGYSGAPYVPKDEVNSASNSDMVMMNIDGTEAVIREQKKNQNESVKQLKAAVDHITDVCNNNSIKHTRSLWLPELERNIVLNNVTDKYNIDRSGITAVIGLTDDPEKQRQYPAAVDLSSCTNLIIAGIAGIGKSTMLQTMLVSVMNDYSCEQVNFYILDFSGRTMKMFSSAPHCGLAAFSDDSEAVTRLFKFIFGNIERRKAMFNKENVGSYKEYIRSHDLPLMLIVIDNYYSFNELYGELADDFMKITRDCAKYGIQVIITCNSMNDVRYKLRQNFGNVLTLILPEKGDYRDAWTISPEFLPKNIKGRGLILSEGRLLEFQTALPCSGDGEPERNTEIVKLCEKIAERDKELTFAEKVRVIPIEQSYAEFADNELTEEFIPVGYNSDDISVYGERLSKLFCYAVSEIGNKGISLVLNNFLYSAKKLGAYTYCVKLKNDIKLDSDTADKVCRDKNDVIEMLSALRDKFKARAIDKKEYLTDDPDGDFGEYLCKKHEKIFIIIDSMSELIDMIYDASNTEDMHTITETYFKNGLGMGIYFIAGFDGAVYGQNYFRTACKNFVEYRQGIHLGGRYDKQKLFDVAMPLSQLSKPADYYTGLTVSDGSEIRVYVPGGQGRE
ncbi:MAG: type VII secretion protein EssC [Oscillospiraceae bacterium]